MPRNGSGTYSKPANTDAVTGQTIESSKFNSLTDDFEQALTDSLAADGQKPMSGNLAMGNNKITGLAAASNNGDALRYEQGVKIAGDTMTGQLVLPDAGPTSDKAAGFRGAPQNTKDIDYTLVLADAGKTIQHGSSSPHAYTIPPNSDVAYPIGTIINVLNAGTGAVTLTRGSGVALRWSGVGTDANRALAQWGWASLCKSGTDVWVVSGAGLS